MTDSPTGRAITKVVCASLRLVSSLSEQLTVSQLLSVKRDLHETLAIINGQIQAAQSNDNKLVIDMSDWEDTPDEEGPSGEDKIEDGNTAGIPIPGPYPVSPPDMEELPEFWYIIDHGYQVGIFTDNASSTRAVTGVPGGHQTKVKSWHDAMTLYNTLYHQGSIVRVQI